MNKDVKEIINDIIDAVIKNRKALTAHRSRSKEKKNDHSKIVDFQNSICTCLNNKKNNYNWETETKNKKRKENDSVDIKGNSNGKPTFIIEIDASRGDQVAKKLLSRIALWGLEKNSIIHYVALLYSDTQNGKKESIKYIKFGYDILQKINKASSVTGIYVANDEDNSQDIEIWDFSKRNSKFQIKTNEEEKIIYADNMFDCAKKIVCSIIKQCDIINYNTLHNKFRDKSYKFVTNEKNESQNKKVGQLKDSTEIYVYNQWREYGRNWRLFKNICKKRGYIIERVWNKVDIEKFKEY